MRKPLPEGPDGGWVGGAASLLGTLIASIIGASVLRLLFPQFVPAAAETARIRWPQSIGLGFAAIILLPVIAIVLLVTGVGWMLGLMLLLLYVVSLFAGGLLGLYAAGPIGTALSGRRASSLVGQIGAVALAATALLVLSWIPVLGPLSVLAVLLLGLGSLLLQGLRRYLGGGTTTA